MSVLIVTFYCTNNPHYRVHHVLEGFILAYLIIVEFCIRNFLGYFMNAVFQLRFLDVDKISQLLWIFNNFSALNIQYFFPSQFSEISILRTTLQLLNCYLFCIENFCDILEEILANLHLLSCYHLCLFLPWGSKVQSLSNGFQFKLF